MATSKCKRFREPVDLRQNAQTTKRGGSQKWFRGNLLAFTMLFVAGAVFSRECFAKTIDCANADLASVAPSFSPRESSDICRAASKALNGALTVEIFKDIGMGVNVLRANESRTSAVENAFWFAAIVRFRGHENLPLSAKADIDRVTRMYVYTNGGYSPKDAAALLSQIGDTAKTLNEGGFVDTMSVDVVIRKKSGESAIKK